MNKIHITITPEDIEEAAKYYELSSKCNYWGSICPIATKLKKLGYAVYYVGTRSISFLDRERITKISDIVRKFIIEHDNHLEKKELDKAKALAPFEFEIDDIFSKE